METITHQVDRLPASGRSAAEQLIGHSLRGNERLIIQVLEMEVDPTPTAPASAQTLPDWCNVYQGMTDEEIDDLDRSITRCNLTRSFE